MSAPRRDAEVALDVMGGDGGANVAIAGAVAAAQEDGARVLLVGDERVIRAELARAGGDVHVQRGSLAIFHAPDSVAIDDKPAAAARSKTTSSMRLACDLVLRGEASGALSAGSSGAWMATALLTFGRIAGVHRPAIGTAVPAFTKSGFAHLVDAGANTRCDALHLAQWAALAAVWCQHARGVERPRIGVVSNGGEDTKGTELTRAALVLIRQLPSAIPVDVVGHVEGHDLNRGTVDVLVTDGFTGNVMLKTAEGMFRFMSEHIRRAYADGSWKERLGGALSRTLFARMRTRLDPREFGAAPLLGLARPAFVAHGSSDAYAIRRGIHAVRGFAHEALATRMADAIARTQAIWGQATHGDTELG